MRMWFPKVMPKPGEGMFYVGRKPQLIGGEMRPVNAEVPEAFEWPKARSLVMMGLLFYLPNKPPQVAPRDVPKIHVTQPPQAESKAEEKPGAAKDEPAKDPGPGAVAKDVSSPSVTSSEAPASGAKPEALKAQPGAPAKKK